MSRRAPQTAPIGRTPALFNDLAAYLTCREQRHSIREGGGRTIVHNDCIHARLTIETEITDRLKD